uniref:PG_binding_1 domain-containing protein n=1 Tax=Caenorhabditis tropicalis TaxID=1561998 RepID=A0A1I7T8M6_9PELO
MFLILHDFLFILLAAIIPITNPRNVDHTNFLQKYGYLPRGSNQLSSTSLSEALKNMQKMAGLEETGELDERTKRMMERPRCGHPDVQTEKPARGKRYAPQQFKWQEKVITYGHPITPFVYQRGCVIRISVVTSGGMDRHSKKLPLRREREYVYPRDAERLFGGPPVAPATHFKLQSPAALSLRLLISYYISI